MDEGDKKKSIPQAGSFLCLKSVRLPSPRKGCHLPERHNKALGLSKIKSGSETWASFPIPANGRAASPRCCTWVVLHHHSRHAPVAGMAGVIGLAVGVAMHVGDVGLVLGEGRGHRHVDTWSGLLVPQAGLLRRGQLAVTTCAFLPVLLGDRVLTPTPFLLQFAVPFLFPPLIF